MLRVTVIIPTYRGRAWIRACLNSVLASEGIKPRIVVFDNASTDGSREIVEKEFPQVELVRSPRNIGFARANNRVIQRAISRGDDYVFLLNEDTRIEPDTLKILTDVAQKHDVSVLGPLQYDYDGNEFESDFESMVRQASLGRHWMKSEFVPTMRIIGAAVLMKLSSLRKVGLFDPIYFLYAEEEDLCLRVLRHGYKVGITPRTQIYHGHLATAEFFKLERLRRFNMIRGQYILTLKNPRQTLCRAVLHTAAQVARDIRRVFALHQVGLATDFVIAGLQVMSLLPRIRRRRRLERDLASELWTNKEMGIGDDREGL